MDFNANDPTKVAEGFGLTAHRILTPEALGSALAAAFSGDQPIFLDVSTEPEVAHLPPVYSWHKAAEKL